MSQRGMPVPIEEINTIMIFLSQIFCRLQFCMIDLKCTARQLAQHSLIFAKFMLAAM